MNNENPFIVGLSLCAFGNIASPDIARSFSFPSSLLSLLGFCFVNVRLRREVS